MTARYASRDRVTKLLAFTLVTSPAAAVTYLFVVSPEALGSPATKLLLMFAAGCLAIASSELSAALAQWALAHRPSQPPPAHAVRTGSTHQSGLLEALTSATMAAAPESRRFS